MLFKITKTSFAISLVVIATIACQTRQSKTEFDSHPYVGAKEVIVPLLPGTNFFISQGAFGKASHSEKGNEWSWDFDVPYGTPVVSVADGKVLSVWQPNAGGGCDAKFSNNAQNIKVEHSDGTVAQYVHIDTNLKPGAVVRKGAVIAHTAMNGWICSPQLHFGIYASRNQLYDSPNRKTIPVKFDGIVGGIAHEGLRAAVQKSVENHNE